MCVKFCQFQSVDNIYTLVHWIMGRQLSHCYYNYYLCDCGNTHKTPVFLKLFHRSVFSCFLRESFSGETLCILLGSCRNKQHGFIKNSAKKARMLDWMLLACSHSLVMEQVELGYLQCSLKKLTPTAVPLSVPSSLSCCLLCQSNPKTKKNAKKSYTWIQATTINVASKKINEKKNFCEETTTFSLLCHSTSHSLHFLGELVAQGM